jgi:hypothetical protein
MHGRTGDRSLTEADESAQNDPAPAYDDPWAVLVQVLAGALADMDQAERRSPRRSRLIPRGFIRDGAIFPGAGR